MIHYRVVKGDTLTKIAAAGSVSKPRRSKGAIRPGIRWSTPGSSRQRPSNPERPPRLLQGTQQPNGTTGWVNVSGSLPADTVSYLDTGLTCNTEYFYRVFAFNAVGDSASSTVVSDTTTACTSGGEAVLRSPRTRLNGR